MPCSRSIESFSEVLGAILIRLQIHQKTIFWAKINFYSRKGIRYNWAKKSARSN